MKSKSTLLLAGYNTGPKEPPNDVQKQNEFALEFYYYVRDRPSCHSFDEFFVMRDYDVRKFKKLAETNEIVRDLYHQARAIIAHRIEGLWRNKAVSDKFAQEMLSIYNPSYLALRKLLMKVQAQAKESAKANINVHMNSLAAPKDKRGK